MDCSRLFCVNMDIMRNTFSQIPLLNGNFRTVKEPELDLKGRDGFAFLASWRLLGSEMEILSYRGVQRCQCCHTLAHSMPFLSLKPLLGFVLSDTLPFFFQAGCAHVHPSSWLSVPASATSFSLKPPGPFPAVFMHDVSIQMFPLSFRFAYSAAHSGCLHGCRYAQCSLLLTHFAASPLKEASPSFVRESHCHPTSCPNQDQARELLHVSLSLVRLPLPLVWKNGIGVLNLGSSNYMMRLEGTTQTLLFVFGADTS